MTITNREQIDNWFRYHPPVGDQVERYAILRDEYGKKVALAITDPLSDFEPFVGDLKQAIYRLCPDSVERDYALNNLDLIEPTFLEQGIEATIAVLRFQIIMPANAAIACNE